MQMVNKNVYRSKVGIWTLFIPLLIINIIFTNNYEYAFITRIVCLAISILIFILSISATKDKNLGIVRYIGVGFLYISILGFFDMEKMWRSGNTELSITFIHFIGYIELVNILLSIIFNKEKIRLRYMHLINIISISFGYLLIRYNEIFLKGSIKNIEFLSLTITGIFLFLIIYLLIRFKLKYKGLIIFSILVYMTLVLCHIGLKFDLNLFIALSNIKIFAYFFIYEFIENDILSLSYLKAYKKLKEFKDKKVLLNRRLSQRNNELSDLNSLIEKSEQKYYKIVTSLSTALIVFENGRRTYSNIKNLDIEDEFIVTDNFDNSYENTLSAVIKEYFDIECENHINDFKIIKDFKWKNCEYKQVEISLVTIFKDKRILLINDVTKIIKQREEFINLEKNIKAEILKEEFHSNISHELRTPINVIYSALQLKDLLIKEEKYERITENNNIIRQNSLRLIRTIDNFIDSNKLSDNKLEYNKKIYNLVEIIDNIILAAKVYMENKSIELTFEPEYEDVYMKCEKSYIERIMLNILSNSVKYGKENGKISIGLKVNKSKIRILVENDNDTIPLNKQNEVFDKFTRVNNSLNRETEGSGLGLFLTKGLVELHGGSITLKNEKEVGNRFIIDFPFEDENYNLITNLETNQDFEIEDLKKKIDIEFSDIYF